MSEFEFYVMWMVPFIVAIAIIFFTLYDILNRNKRLRVWEK